MVYELLNVDKNAKTVKGQKKGYLTGVLYLAPANESGYETCAGRSKGCTASCLFTAGRAGIFKNINESRIRKTRLFFEQPLAFWAQLISDITKLKTEARNKGLVPVVRLNGTSDIDWMSFKPTGINIFEAFHLTQFYDYTKVIRKNYPDNYHVTFSRSENNNPKVKQALKKGLNVAIVFDTLPTEYQGYPVVDGDEDDLRFLNDKRQVIIGLKAKGKARKDDSGFVVKA